MEVTTIAPLAEQGSTRLTSALDGLSPEFKLLLLPSPQAFLQFLQMCRIGQV